MLKEIKRTIVATEQDGTQVTIPPSNTEIMNKINEIVRYVNRMEKEKQNKPMEEILKIRRKGC